MFPHLTPLTYLRIKCRYKCYFDWVFPAIFALAYAALSFTSFAMPLSKDTGIIYAVTELLKLLIGFYIASLCAIATFHSKVLDSHLHGPALLHHKREPKKEILTRRRFLSFMFGYLAFLSIVLYLSGMSSSWLANIVYRAVPGNYPQARKIITIAGTSVFCLFAAQLLSLTLLGLHYLCDRLHRDP